MKLHRCLKPICGLCRPPRGGRGLKSQWQHHLVRVLRRRPPRGGRGLKYKINARKIKPEKSPPSRGAWIEIPAVPPTSDGLGVAPLAGGVD